MRALVTSSYFPSRNEGGALALVVKNPIVHANFTALLCYISGVIGDGIFTLILIIRIVDLFASVTLTST